MFNLICRRKVPVNCWFEICGENFLIVIVSFSLYRHYLFSPKDLDQWGLPYPDNHYDVIHARVGHNVTSILLWLFILTLP